MDGTETKERWEMTWIGRVNSVIGGGIGRCRKRLHQEDRRQINSQSAAR